jgi:1-acyl-sn-glycerol-3-phosphate acyltransferase
MALKSGPFYMSEEAKVAVTPVYLVGAHHLMNKGQILPSQGGVVVVEYQQPIPYKGQTHEQMKEQVEKALKDAEKKWEGKKMRRGGYSVAWCVLPIAILTWILLKLFYL